MSHQPVPNKNVTLIIDGRQVTVPEGTRILEAAQKANVHIPTLCDHPELCKRAVCRICVVEADGRGKLLAACANDVWEGVNIVTSNMRILNIRKTILELILANHPQECLTCIRSTKCELQSLAESFGIRASPFPRDAAQDRPPVIENETLVRNMDKCVKCGRCVEICQAQTVRAINSAHRSGKYEITAPYRQALNEGSCVFCGRCAEVCPVGAIYEHDQTAEVQAALNDSSRKTIAQIPQILNKALDETFGFTAGTVTTGKITAALKLLRFEKVYNDYPAVSTGYSEQYAAIQAHINSGGALPVISCRSSDAVIFVKQFYPDLSGRLVTGKTPRRIFADAVKADYAGKAGVEPSQVTSVTFTAKLSGKYESGAPDRTDFALTAGELARMIKLAGIDLNALPESSDIEEPTPARIPEPQVKKETVCGFANARKILDTIRKGECQAQWVEIADE